MSSRFLNVSPRAFIRDLDNENIFAPIQRVSGQKDLETFLTPFSDSDTIIFENNVVVTAPYMLSPARARSSGFFTGSLRVTASIKDRNSYQSRRVVTDRLAEYPYRESTGAGPIAFKSGSEIEGFPESIYPGFSFKANDKISVSFNMPAQNSIALTKLNRVQSARDPSGPLYLAQRSGFVYYSPTNRNWSDVASRDPSTGNTISNYDPSLSLAGTSAVSGYFQLAQNNNRYLSQFSSSPYSITSESPYYAPGDETALKARGYHVIGEPTSVFGAPNSPRYHARSDETFKMIDYSDFALAVDRISVNIPVRVYRTQMPPTGSGETTDLGFGRDIDNYVFFVYVQNRSNATEDSKQDVSSSIRYLIAKESFCFYNSPTLDTVSGGLLPIHDYGFSAPFSMSHNVASSSGSPVEIQQDFNVSLNFRPLSFNSVFGTTSKHACDINVGGNKITGSVYIQNYWTGGQRASGSLGQFGRVNTTSNLNVRSGSIPSNFSNPFLQASPRSLVSSFWEGTSDLIDSGSGFSTSGVEIGTVSNYDTSSETIALIFPEDEIVFGIESGANSNLLSPGGSYEGIDNDVLAVTGSRLEIRSGNSNVIFYGSLIARGKAFDISSYQIGGSDAIHEDIHEIGPLDQFDTFDATVLSGSYVDNIVYGDFLAGERKRVARASQGESWITGSLQRNIRIISQEETYYDTYVPPVSVISGGLANTTQVGPIFSSSPQDPNRLLIIEDTNSGFAFDDNRYNNTMLKRSFTYENIGNQKRIKNLSLRMFYDVLGTTYASSISGDAAKFALYYNGEIPTVDVGEASEKNYTGASSLRYGLMGTRILNPSAVYRRDRYGQIRDMLEQTRDGKIVTQIKGRDTVTRGVVFATFVSASSDTITDGIFTQCSNLSAECTSSVPFTDDGQARNRGSLPSYTPRFGPNNLIFGVTGSFGLQ